MEKYLTIISVIVFIILLVLVSYSDIKSKLIPNKYCILLILNALIFERNISLVERLVEAIIIVLPLTIIYFIRKESLGGGDIKLVFACAFTIGIEKTLWGLFWGMIMAAIMGIILKKLKRNESIPLAPFISIGMIVVVLFYYI